ncbi:MAG: 3-hydroxybutyryl-CoA dehydrogenase [Chitinophagales bacterium]|nr:3-hydroxybutyryl-CoA dehydrogenase [Chitinophagales bacterium]
MKTIEQIHSIAVVGAGTMGAGIAQLAAQAGYNTILYDVEDKALRHGIDAITDNLTIAVEKGKIDAAEQQRILSRIHPSGNFSDLAADVVIEAIVERLEIKTNLFRQLAQLTEADESIFCSNTSSIPITMLSAAIPYPERVAGMHFFNPAYLMKLVEVVSGERTAEACAKTVFALAVKMGKQPVMAKDKPGFIVNRIGKMYHTESLRLLEEKVAPVAAIDQLLESRGFRMGPFRLIDLIGVDANLNVTKSLYELMQHEPRFRPSDIQQQMVDAGCLGKKTGRGFYRY